MTITAGDYPRRVVKYSMIPEQIGIMANTNANPNHVRLYNEFIAKCLADIQPEEPACCQQLYAILDDCIQEVLTNEKIDCAVVIEKANSNFQTNYHDNMIY